MEIFTRVKCKWSLHNQSFKITLDKKKKECQRVYLRKHKNIFFQLVRYDSALIFGVPKCSQKVYKIRTQFFSLIASNCMSKVYISVVAD